MAIKFLIDLLTGNLVLVDVPPTAVVAPPSSGGWGLLLSLRNLE